MRAIGSTFIAPERIQASCDRKPSPLCASWASTISRHRSKHVSEFENERLDHVITVCDNARETCPIFFGVTHRLYHDFEDPAAQTGSEAERLDAFRRVRDELRSYLTDFARNTM